MAAAAKTALNGYIMIPPLSLPLPLRSVVAWYDSLVDFVRKPRKLMIVAARPLLGERNGEVECSRHQ